MNGLATFSQTVNGVLDAAHLPAILNATVLSGIFWAIAKVYCIVFFAILVRGTLPRFRIDQLTEFGWKRLIPLVLILLVAITFLKELI
jgi:NADH-quinone oxidoreductase subunit H